MLEVHGIQKSFGSLEVLKGVDLSVQKGDVVAILGPSGSGKTTLLRCINFLEKADGGTMTFDGEQYQFGHVTKKQVNAMRRKTGFVFQSYNLFLNKTALQNVTEGLIVARRMPKKQAEEIGPPGPGAGGAVRPVRLLPSSALRRPAAAVAIARAVTRYLRVSFSTSPPVPLDPDSPERCCR